MRTTVWSVFLGLSLSATMCFAWDPNPVIGNQVNQEYQRLWNTSNLWTNSAVQVLRQYKVLIIPGFMASPAIEANKIKFLNEMYTWLQSENVETEYVMVAPFGTPEENGPQINAAIAASDKPVWMVLASKGGQDFIAGMVTRHDLWPKVKGVISLQVPYYGSPLFDAFTSNPIEDAFLNLVSKYWGGTVASWQSMRTDVAAAFMQQYQSDLQSLVSVTPWISFAAWKDPEFLRIDTVLKPMRDWLYYVQGLRNDGFVPWQSEIMPGTDYITQPGLDHLTTFSATPFINFDRTHFAETIMYMMLLRVHGI